MMLDNSRITNQNWLLHNLTANFEKPQIPEKLCPISFKYMFYIIGVLDKHLLEQVFQMMTFLIQNRKNSNVQIVAMSLFA